MTSICPRPCICFESLLTNISMFIVCVITSYLLVLGDLENSQCIIGEIFEKKILILVVGYWFPYMRGKRLRWKVEGWGGGGCAQNSEPTLPDILVGTFSRTTPFMFFHPSSLPKLWNNSVSMPSCRPTLIGAGKAVLVFRQVCPRV